MKIKICKLCNKEYEINSNFQQYCSKCQPINNSNLCKRWRKLNKEHIKKYTKKYLKNHPDIKRKSDKKYYLKNKKTINEYALKYYHRRILKDINYKLKHFLRSRIFHALKNNSKSKITTELLGCSIKYLKKYLEKQFTKNMTWQNYGKWHLDHIKPCASFDLSDPEQQKLCFHYTNLQPLWAEENLKKGVKYNE